MTRTSVSVLLQNSAISAFFLLMLLAFSTAILMLFGTLPRVMSDVLNGWVDELTWLWGFEIPGSLTPWLLTATISHDERHFEFLTYPMISIAYVIDATHVYRGTRTDVTRSRMNSLANQVYRPSWNPLVTWWKQTGFLTESHKKNTLRYYHICAKYCPHFLICCWYGCNKQHAKNWWQYTPYYGNNCYSS